MQTRNVAVRNEHNQRHKNVVQQTAPSANNSNLSGRHPAAALDTSSGIMIVNETISVQDVAGLQANGNDVVIEYEEDAYGYSPTSVAAVSPLQHSPEPSLTSVNSIQNPSALLDQQPLLNTVCHVPQQQQQQAVPIQAASQVSLEWDLFRVHPLVDHFPSHAPHSAA